MRRIQFFFGSIFGVVFLAASCALAAPTGEKKVVVLSEVSDIAGLSAAKKDIKDESKIAGARVETVTFSLDPAACVIYSASDGYDYLDINGLKPEAKPGAPQVPMKTFVVELEKDAVVYGVEVVSGKFGKVKQEVNLVPMPEPSVYRDILAGGKYAADPAIYSRDTQYPGKLVSYDTGTDNTRQYVFVRLFPLQLNPKSHKAVLLSEATINVYYGSAAAAGNTTTAQGQGQRPPAPPPGPGPTVVAMTEAQSVIICPASLLTQATALMNFHVTEGISSAVVTTEDIAASYAAAENPTYNGYNNSANPGYANIKLYNFILAKQIVSYLRDMASHPNLTYVTLLGDGLLVPPSYYVFDPDAGNNSYPRWIPTDLYYASPEYDYVPNFRVGRLPVSNTTEAMAMVNKITAWYTSANWSWFGKAAVIGGDPHAGHIYCGEMNIEDALNKDYLSGMNLARYFDSDGKENKLNVEPLLRDGNRGLVYHIGHGSGSYLSLDGNPVFYATDLLAYTTTVPAVPIFISAACYNGSFDLDLYKPKTWSVSFGEALLKSKAGAIAYFGGSRENYGDALFHYDQGRVVITKETGCLELFNFALKSYHLGSDDLGKLYIDAVGDFVANNDMSGYNTENTDNIFLFVFLGDPALKIPAQQAVAEYSQAVDTAVNPAGYDGNDIPQFTAAPVTVTAATTSPAVKWKLIDPVAKTVLEADTLDFGPAFSRTYGPTAPQQYLVRTSTQNAVASTDYTKEGWLFYAINPNAGLVMHVSDITMAVVGNRTKNATATVTVVNQSGIPVSGALVSGQWSGLTTDADTGVTNASGQVTLSSDGVPRGSTGVFTFCVVNIGLAGASYDPLADIETCDSVTLYVL